MLGTVFLSVVLLGFGFSLFIAGVFGAYFGQGKSRGVGLVLAVFAVLVIAIFAALTWPLLPGVTPIFDPDVVGQSLVAVLGATLGFALGAVTFIMAVMRS